MKMLVGTEVQLQAFSAFGYRGGQPLSSHSGRSISVGNTAGLCEISRLCKL